MWEPQVKKNDFNGYADNPLTHYHMMAHFDALKTYTVAVENIVRKEETACNNVFYPIW